MNKKTAGSKKSSGCFLHGKKHPAYDISEEILKRVLMNQRSDLLYEKRNGKLKIVIKNLQDWYPIENASVKISFTGEPEKVIEELSTDNAGNLPILELDAPPLEYSMQPMEQQPYSEYTIQVKAEG